MDASRAHWLFVLSGRDGQPRRTLEDDRQLAGCVWGM